MTEHRGETVLEHLQRLELGCAASDAMSFFDGLPAVIPEEMMGRWRGREFATGHPMDGLLAASGWYGKQFDGTEHVHPLLFTDRSGHLYAADPRKMPLKLATRIDPNTLAKGKDVFKVTSAALKTRRHRARLREVVYRGSVTTGMVYDHLPIIDVFRRVDDMTVVGVMDYREEPEPYFFILERDRSQ